MIESLHTQYCYDHKMYGTSSIHRQLSFEIRLHKLTRSSRHAKQSLCLAVWRGRVVMSYIGIRTSSSSTGMEGTCISTFVAAAAAEVSVAWSRMPEPTSRAFHSQSSRWTAHNTSASWWCRNLISSCNASCHPYHELNVTSGEKFEKNVILAINTLFSLFLTPYIFRQTTSAWITGIL